MKSLLILVCTAATMTLSAELWAQSPDGEMRTLIEQALNEPASITLQDTTLGDAIRQLSEQTGIEIVMDPEVMNLTPRGANTRVRKVDLANLSVREALHELFLRLGMTFMVRDQYVEIVPKRVLHNLGRPPTWVELKTLAELSATQPGLDAGALAELELSLQFKVNVPRAWTLLSEAIRNVGAGAGDEVLSVACDNLGWTWSLGEQRIVITPLDLEVQRRLRQPISMRATNRPLFDVIQMLAKRLNVDIHVEPGALASLPEHVRQNFSVTAHDRLGDEILDAIAANTGLGYLIEPGGVLLYNPGNSQRATGTSDPGLASAASDPYVAKVVTLLEDGKTIEWLIRRSELPDDLRQMRERYLKETFEAVRRQAVQVQPTEPRP